MFIRKFTSSFPPYILLVLLTCSCTKIDSTTLGSGLIPAVDNINTFDTTINVIANNIDTAECDSVYRSDLHAVGVIPADPYFGKTTANMYFELKPQYYPFKFLVSDTALVLDSVVLVLKYSHSYGDTLTPQKVQVFKITDEFNDSTTYSTCNIFNYDNAQPLGEQSYIPARLIDSIHAFREDANYQLRIKLSNSFAQGFIDDSAVIFKTDTTFTTYFKGFAIVPDETFGGNSINYFDLNSTETRLSFYLRNQSGGVKDTSVVDFAFTNYAGEANSVVRERGTSEITNAVSHQPTGDSIIYIQTAPGSYAELKIPGLSGLSNSVINRAELIVDEIYTSAPFLTTPNYLYLDTKDTSTNNTYIPIPCDFSLSNAQPNFSYFGGTKKIIKDNNGNSISQYVFNISRYVQSIVTKGSNNAVLRLRAPYNIVNRNTFTDRCNQLISPFNFSLNSIAEGGVKLNGSNNTPAKMRLHIIYSKL